MDAPVNQHVVNNGGWSKVSDDTIKRIILFILIRYQSENGEMVPARGTLSEADKKFGVSKRSTSRFWIKKAKRNKNNPSVDAFCASPKKRGP